MTDINWQYQKAITLDFVTCKQTFVCLRKKIGRQMKKPERSQWRDDTSALLNPP